jgi:excisionase family DNA binding protein
MNADKHNDDGGPAPKIQERATYSVVEAGERLGISRGLAYKLAVSGELPTIRLGNRLLVPRHALDKLIGIQP